MGALKLILGELVYKSSGQSNSDAVLGAALGCSAVVLLIAVVACCVICRRKSKVKVVSRHQPPSGWQMQWN